MKKLLKILSNLLDALIVVVLIFIIIGLLRDPSEYRIIFTGISLIAVIGVKILETLADIIGVLRNGIVVKEAKKDEPKTF